jgi:hypothetical protein
MFPIPSDLKLESRDGYGFDVKAWTASFWINVVFVELFCFSLHYDNKYISSPESCERRYGSVLIIVVLINFSLYSIPIDYVYTAGNRHKQNSRFCKEIREDNFRFWWRRVHEDASQGMYMSKIENCFFTARILQNQRMLCCGECFHD